MKMKLKSIQLVLFTLFTPVLFAQNLQKGWQYLGQNEFEKSAKSFQDAIKNNENVAEAHLGLSFVNTIIDKDEADILNPYFSFIEKSSNPNPYVEALWSFNLNMLSKENIAIIEKLSASSNTKISAYAHHILGSYYYKMKDETKYMFHYNANQPIRKWQILGNFENISKSGFHKDFEALAHPEKDYVFKNKYGGSIKWQQIDQTDINGWLNFNHHYFVSNSLFYAQTFYQATNDQEVQLRIGVTGAVKVWVNDQLVLQEPEERDTKVDHFVIQTNMNKGNNRILIQIGSSDLEGVELYVRLTDLNGQPIENSNFTNQLTTYNKNNEVKSKIVANETENFFKDKIANQPDEILNHLVLAQYYILESRIEEAKEIVNNALERFPNSLSFLSDLTLIYMHDDNSTGSSTILEKIKNENPENLIALKMKYQEEVDKENYDEAIKILDVIEKKGTKKKYMIGSRIAMAAFKGQMSTMLNLIEDAYKAYPDDYSIVNLKYIVEKEINQNQKMAIKVIENYLNDFQNDEATELLFDLYIEKGEFKKAYALYENIIKYNPTYIGYVKAIADSNFITGNYDEAIKNYSKVLQIAPYIGEYHANLAKTFSEMKMKKEAIEKYKDAILFNPSDYDSREKLRDLEGKPEVFSNFSQPDVYDIYKKSPKPTDFPEDNSMVLVEEVQKVLYPEGGSEEKHIFLVKVFNSDGIDTWKEYSVQRFWDQTLNIEKAEILKKNGSIVKAQTNGSDIVFSNLEIEDAIHITYKIKNYHSGILGKHIWEEHFFKYFFPIQYTSFSLMVPENQNLNYKVLHAQIEPQVEKVNEFKKYTWKVQNVPSYKSENLMPELEDVAPILHLSTISDWNVINNWYADISNSKADVNYEVKQTVETLFKGKDNLSKKEIVETIYNYIVNEIHYISVPFLQSDYIPQRASNVLNTKQGDCKDVSTLFVSMCKAMNIDADLVLVNTSDNGLESLVVPNNQFNHCIAHVNLDQIDYNVELTDSNLPFSTASQTLQNALSLRINENQNSTLTSLKMPNSVKTFAERKSEISFDKDVMTVAVNSKKYGDAASGMRSNYEFLGDQERFKGFQNDIADTDNKNNQLIEYAFISGLNDNSDFVEYTYKYKQANSMTEVAGLSIFKIPYVDGLNTLFFANTVDREFPISLWNYFVYISEKEEVVIQIPTGKTLVELPKPVTIQDAHFSYTLTFELKGNSVVTKRRFDLLKDIVNPENYKSFKENIELLAKADKTQLAFKS
jgi:tetratricopeptide (TPR) repeat protein